jgi:hypothetical protein
MTPDKFNQQGVSIMKNAIIDRVLRQGTIALLVLGVLAGGEAVAGHGVEDAMYMTADFGSSTLNARVSDYESFAMQAAGEGSDVSVLDSNFDRNDTGWSLVLYGAHKEHLGMEVGYMKLGTMSWEGMLGVDDGAGQTQLPVNVGIKSRGWTASALGIWALNERVQLEGRVGAYFGKSKTFAASPGDNTGAVRISDKDSSISAMLGGNVVFAVGKSSALTLGYTWFNDVAGKSLGRASVGYRLFLGRGER